MKTSVSLLERLRHSPEEEDWQQLVLLYTPLIQKWIRRYSSSQQDADDVVQQVLAVLVKKLPEFHRERCGAFRCWLRAITVNCLRELWKSQKMKPVVPGGSDFQQILAKLTDPESELSQLWDAEHDLYLLKSLLSQAQEHFPQTTWQAFQRVAIAGQSAGHVADDLGISVNSVYIARSRVMSRLRQLGQGLLD